MNTDCEQYRLEYIKAHDGVEVPVRVFGGEATGTPVVMLHGIRSHSGWFMQSARFMASRGHPVYSFDRRGSGSSRETRGHARGFGDWIEEIHAVAAYALGRRAAQRVHLVGHCFGAVPAALFACCHPEKVASLILPTPGIHTHVTVAPATKVRIAVLRFCASTRRIPFALAPEDLADLEPDRRFIRDDTLSLQEVTAGLCFEVFRARRSLQRHVHDLTAPVFMALAGRDRISDNRRNTTFFDLLPSKSKRLVMYPDATHILEFSNEKDRFLGDLADWLKECDARKAT
jgi:acylglycerol lipase